MNKQFSWGRVIETFHYNFDGQVMVVTKYHPWKQSLSGKSIRGEASTHIEYHCEELRMASDNIQHLIIAWIAQKNIGLNQQALVHGVCRALGIEK